MRLNPQTGQTEPYWQAIWREGGRGTAQKSLSLGFVPEEVAQKALRKLEARKELGLDLVPAPKATSAPSSGPSIHDLWGSTVDPWPEWPACRMRDYYQSRKVRPKTLRAADSARRAFLPIIGDTPLSTVTGATIDRLVVALQKQGLKSKSIENYIVCLGTSLKLAFEEGLIPKAIRLPSLSHDDAAEAIFLTPEEVACLYAALQPGTGLLIRFTETLFTRSGESMHARWENLKRAKNGTPTELAIRPCPLPDGTQWAPKTKPRTVYIPPELGALLREEWVLQGQPSSGWIFPNKERPGWPRTDFRKALWGACKRANLPMLHPHSLRHTGASRFAAAGATVPEIMAAGGWSSPDVPLKIYAHAHQDGLVAVAARAEVRSGVDQNRGLISTGERLPQIRQV
jgi:integrase